MSAARPLRILNVEYGMAFGGAVVSLAELLEGLYEVGGVESVVVTFLPEETTRGLFPRAEVLHERRLLSYRTRDSIKRWVGDGSVPKPLAFASLKSYAALHALQELALTWRLFRIMKSRPIDLVHVNNGWEMSAVRAARWAGLPLVVHVRGLVKLKLDAKGRYIGRYRQAAGTEEVVAISDAVRDSLLAVGLPRDRVRTIYNPVSAGTFRSSGESSGPAEVRERWGLGPDDIVFGVFGRVVPWKGQLELLQALEGIVDECPRLKVMIVGDAADSTGEYMDRVRQAAERPPLHGHVILTGYQHEVDDIFAAVDAVIHCSVDPEPFGRVVAEGMAHGKPTIAVDEGGPPEIITHGVDGLLVAPRDPASMQGAVLELYRDPDLRARLGRNAEATVERRFSAEAIASEMLDLYREHVGG